MGEPLEIYSLVSASAIVGAVVAWEMRNQLRAAVVTIFLLVFWATAAFWVTDYWWHWTWPLTVGWRLYCLLLLSPLAGIGGLYLWLNRRNTCS